MFLLMHSSPEVTTGPVNNQGQSGEIILVSTTELVITGYLIIIIIMHQNLNVSNESLALTLCTSHQRYRAL